MNNFSIHLSSQLIRVHAMQCMLLVAHLKMTGQSSSDKSFLACRCCGRTNRRAGSSARRRRRQHGRGRKPLRRPSIPLRQKAAEVSFWSGPLRGAA
jgi:hypothetical protein